MKLENQCVSLELAKKLKSLGVKQRGCLFAYYFNAGKYSGAIVDARMYDGEDGADDGFWEGKLVAAFTVAELGEILPDSIDIKIEGCPSWLMFCHDKGGRKYDVTYHHWVENNQLETDHTVRGSTEADARATMVVYLKENNLLKI